MILYLDFDSTINNLSEEWLNWINNSYSTNYTHDDVTDWFWYNNLQYDAFQFFKEKPYDNIEPLPNSKEFFDWCFCEFDTKILTSTHDESLEQVKDNFIYKHYGYCDVIHEHEKYIYAYNNILIDDRALNCENWIEYGGKSILYNHDNTYRYSDVLKKDYKDKIEICYNYEEVKQVLRELKIKEKD